MNENLIFLFFCIIRFSNLSRKNKYVNNVINLRKLLGLYDENKLKMKIKSKKNSYVSYDNLLENIKQNIYKQKLLSLKRSQSSIIVSLSTYPKRFKYIPIVIFSLIKNTIVPFKIVITLTNEDQKLITEELLDFNRTGIIEILKITENLKPHNKYYYTMLKYRKNPIITIDDDQAYSTTFIEELLRGYEKYPNYISARTVRVKTYYSITHSLTKFGKWISYNGLNATSAFHFLPEGVGGVLYPPNILNLSEDNSTINLIRKYITVDDLLLNFWELKKGIKIASVPKLSKIKNVPIYAISLSGLYKVNFKSLNDKGVNELLVPLHKIKKLYDYYEKELKLIEEAIRNLNKKREMEKYD